jgi:phosphoribosyl 1,2-cyclic phosphodiesterase
METFLDIRRKVGNQIIRIYLLDDALTEERIERINATLRGPKKEFKDFAKYFILRIQENGDEIRFLTETGIYENMRIVGTDSQKIAQMETEEIVGKYTDALKIPEKYNTSFILNTDSEIIPKG